MKKEMVKEAPVENRTTALVVAQRDGMTALQVVENAEKLQQLGQVFAASGFFGAKTTPSIATAALVNCVLEGLSPVQYRAKYHTFDNGQTGIKSDYIQREFHKRGGTWTFTEWTGEKCDMVFHYKGDSLPFCVTLDEFKANGVAMKTDGKAMKENWAKFPKEMLKARCMATAIRAICPEALEGMYTQEEVADFAKAELGSAVKTGLEHYTPRAVAEAVEAVAVDYGVCPCGSVKGQRWSEIPSEKLEVILATPEGKAKALTAEHRSAIEEELARREAAQEGEEALTPEVVEAECWKAE